VDDGMNSAYSCSLQGHGAENASERDIAQKNLESLEF
jgi:hypothetical protein